MIHSRGLIIYPDEISTYWNNLLMNSRLNLLGIHPTGGLTGGKAVDDAIVYLQIPGIKLLLNELTVHNIAIEYEMHALSWLLPREMFNKHQNWFRMNVNQDRVNDFNFCPSNKDALSYISERAAVLAQIFVPTTNRYHFWLDDVADSRCHCPDCSTLNSSDASLLVYNAILNGIRTINPQASQCFLAYHDTMEAPTRVEPESGIFLEYAPMKRNLHRPLTDPYSEINAKEIKPIDGLLSIFGTRNAKALDYWLDNSYASEWTKPMKSFQIESEVIRRDIDFYQKKGFETVTCFACFLGEEYFNLYHNAPDVASYSAAFPE